MSISKEFRNDQGDIIYLDIVIKGQKDKHIQQIKTNVNTSLN